MKQQNTYEKKKRETSDQHQQGQRETTSGAQNTFIAGELSRALQMAVPLRVLACVQREGPSQVELGQRRPFADLMSIHERILAHDPSTPPGTTALLFNQLAETLAILSFFPGGMPPLFGDAFDAVTILARFYGLETARDYQREVMQRYTQHRPQVWATCFLHDASQDPIYCNVTHLLERLHDQDLGSLYQGWEKSHPTCEEPNLIVPEELSHLLLGWMQRYEPALATWMQRGENHIVSCSLQWQPFDAWIEVAAPHLHPHPQ